VTGKPNNSGRSFVGNGWMERASVERWSRQNYRGSAEPRTTPLTQPELAKAVQAIERSIVAGSRNGQQAEGLVSAYKDCLQKIDRG